MKTELDFFHIELKHLKDQKVFPFFLYIFNPVKKSYSTFLQPNQPLQQEHEKFLDYLLSRGAILAVPKKQKKTFLSATQNKEEDIPSLEKRDLHDLEKERIMYIKLLELQTEKDGPFIFREEFKKAVAENNFQKIIENARSEIICFRVDYSQTVSLAGHFAKNMLNKDNHINRIVAVSYYVAKYLNIIDEQTLSDIICGAYFSQIGHTQSKLSTLRTPFLNLFDKDKVNFKKHTILSHHLLKKSGIAISEDCKKIVLDHHERFDGNGYPNMKVGNSIELPTLVVGIVSHLFEFSSGKINGSKQSLRSTLYSFANKSFKAGLELEFGDTIYNNIATLIDFEKEKENKKAA